MPVHQFIHDHRLRELGLRNYWGYNTIAFLAPHNGYSARSVLAQAQEFKAMVKALHRAGIEVILDVVYNHTGEGNHLGPTLSMRGIDNPAYYRLLDGNPREYLDCGTGTSTCTSTASASTSPRPSPASSTRSTGSRRSSTSSSRTRRSRRSN
jgi:glycogen operon protein